MARGHLAKAGAHTSDGLLAKVNEFFIFFLAASPWARLVIDTKTKDKT